MVDEGCTCGCGKSKETAIKEMMRVESLNYEQAESRLSQANAIRRERRERA